MTLFSDLGLLPELVQAVQDLGYTEPTPIQAQAIPALLEGDRDLVGLAQTGTGKTAAFGLPLLQRIDPARRVTQALIIAPTRELCLQVTREIESYSKYLGQVAVVSVYGGAEIRTQIRALSRGAHVIVATPGRLIDLLERGAADISEVRTLVLDEADEMLNMGFQEDIDHILSHTPDSKSTWLFSATLPPEVRRISANYMENPVELSAGSVNTTAENIRHLYYVVQARLRYEALKRIVDVNRGIFGIVFCRTKMETQEVAEKLIRDGYNADALHGDLSQPQRDKVMGRFRERALQVLVATDVAARGIDVSNVTHVIHYQLPDDIENYTHRSGRTARAGKSGVSVALVHTKEIGRIRQLERQLNRKFLRELLPTGVEVCEAQLFGLVDKMKSVEVREEQMEAYLPRIMEALEGLSKEDLIARFAALEFNRFLDYYKDAPDLNPSEAPRHDSAGERYITGTNMFINLGRMDGLDRGTFVKFLASTASISPAKIGRINLKGVYTFFEVEPDIVNRVLEAFQGQKYKGRKIRVDIEESKKSGGGFEGKSFGGHSEKPRKQEFEGRSEESGQQQEVNLDAPKKGYFKSKRTEESTGFGEKGGKFKREKPARGAGEGKPAFWEKIAEKKAQEGESGTVKEGAKKTFGGTKETSDKPKKKKGDLFSDLTSPKKKRESKFASKDKGKPRWLK